VSNNVCCSEADSSNISISCQLDLFDKLVKPILLYGCEVWGFGNNEISEPVRLKFCKVLLHLKTTTPNCIVYGELGRQIPIPHSRIIK
jgi:hypothetical protein